MTEFRNGRGIEPLSTSNHSSHTLRISSQIVIHEYDFKIRMCEYNELEYDEMCTVNVWMWWMWNLCE